MRKLVTRPQAQFDVELDSLMTRIGATPFQFPQIHPSVRRALLKRFPYSVYFLVGDEQVEVIAVLHQHRHPNTWRNRL